MKPIYLAEQLRLAHGTIAQHPVSESGSSASVFMLDAQSQEEVHSEAMAVPPPMEPSTAVKEPALPICFCSACFQTQGREPENNIGLPAQDLSNPSSLPNCWVWEKAEQGWVGRAYFSVVVPGLSKRQWICSQKDWAESSRQIKMPRPCFLHGNKGNIVVGIKCLGLDPASIETSDKTPVDYQSRRNLPFVLSLYLLYKVSLYLFGIMVLPIKLNRGCTYTSGSLHSCYCVVI